jgi:hypothetical protein
MGSHYVVQAGLELLGSSGLSLSLLSVGTVPPCLVWQSISERQTSTKSRALSLAPSYFVPFFALITLVWKYSKASNLSHFFFFLQY